MIQFLVIDLNEPSSNYIVEDLLSLINEIYEVELMNGNSFDTVNQWFNGNHKVFKIEGTVEEIN
jgi:hypothetical protein